MKKEIICTVCPRGCHIRVEGEGEKVLKVEGYICKQQSCCFGTLTAAAVPSDFCKITHPSFFLSSLHIMVFY